MIERCPCCHAQLKKRDDCPRCKASLKTLNKCEKAAKLFLLKAIKAMVDKDVEGSASTVIESLRLKKTKEGIVFRDFLIHQQSKLILALLKESQFFLAKKKLNQVRHLMPQNKQLQKLNTFTDYLILSVN